MCMPIKKISEFAKKYFNKIYEKQRPYMYIRLWNSHVGECLSHYYVLFIFICSIVMVLLHKYDNTI